MIFGNFWQNMIGCTWWWWWLNDLEAMTGRMLLKVGINLKECIYFVNVNVTFLMICLIFLYLNLAIFNQILIKLTTIYFLQWCFPDLSNHLQDCIKLSATPTSQNPIINRWIEPSPHPTFFFVWVLLNIPPRFLATPSYILWPGNRSSSAVLKDISIL